MEKRYEKSEKWLERQLVKKIGERGGVALKYSNANRTGYPDRLVLLPGGRAYFVELKSKGRKPTRLQSLRHEELRALGFGVAVVDSPEALDDFLLRTL